MKSSIFDIVVIWILILMSCLAFVSCSTENDEPQPIQKPEYGPYVEDIDGHNLDVKNSIVKQLIGNNTDFNTNPNILLEFGQSFMGYAHNYEGANLPLVNELIFTTKDIRAFSDSSMVFDVKPNINLGGAIIEIKVGVLIYDEELLTKVHDSRGFYIRGSLENVEIRGGKAADYFVETIEITYASEDFDLIPMKIREN